MRATRLIVVSVVSAIAVVATLRSAAAAQPTSGQYVLCYSNASASPFYLSADFQIDVTVGPDAKSENSDAGASRRALDALQKEFFAYLQADRGYRDSSAFPTTCQGTPRAAELVAVRDLLHKRFAQLTFVETGWKPGMKAAVKPAAAPTPPTTPTPAARPAAAPRPAAKAATSRATAPAVNPPPDVPAQYSYCYGYGSPAGSTTPKHLYVSQAFQIPVGERSNQTEEAFEKYLGAAHPGETISTSCLHPSPLEAAQKSRQADLEKRRRPPAKLDVVEVEWKR